MNDLKNIGINTLTMFIVIMCLPTVVWVAGSFVTWEVLEFMSGKAIRIILVISIIMGLIMTWE